MAKVLRSILKVLRFSFVKEFHYTIFGMQWRELNTNSVESGYRLCFF